MAETRVLSELNATVWKIEASAGDRLSEGDTLMILESMKMEIPVTAPRGGVVKAILVKEEQPVREGETLATMEG